MPLHVSSTMCSSSGGQNSIIEQPSGAQVERGLVLSQPVHRAVTYRCDTRCCIMTTLPDGIPRNCGSILEWGRNVFLPFFWYMKSLDCVTGPDASRRHDCFICKDRMSSVQYKLAEIISIKPWPVLGSTKRRIVWLLVANFSTGGQVARTCSWTLAIQYQSWECNRAKTPVQHVYSQCTQGKIYLLFVKGEGGGVVFYSYRD